MKKRVKPVCLLIIDNLHPELLLDSEIDLNFKKIKDIFPSILLKSSDKNIDFPWNAYMEIGTGISNEDVSHKQSNISLARSISMAGLKQLHITETENYPNLTYFFNGKISMKNEKEDWICVKNIEIDNYLNYPEMMTSKITSKITKEIERQDYDFILANYSNLLTNESDKSKALKTLDSNLKKVIDHILAYNGALIIASNTTSTKNNNIVPIFFISNIWKDKSHINYDNGKNINQQIPCGLIYDIAPTILKIMGISKPQQMIGNSLI